MMGTRVRRGMKASARCKAGQVRGAGGWVGGGKPGRGEGKRRGREGRSMWTGVKRHEREETDQIA